MQQQTDPNSVLQHKRLSANDSYYNNVFKKTERLVSTVFYVLSFVTDKDTQQAHITSVTNRAFATHEVSLELLAVYEPAAPEHIFRLQHALAALSSSLAMATAAGVFTEATYELLCADIDLIHRRLQHEFGGSVSAPPTFLLRTEQAAAQERPRPHSARPASRTTTRSESRPTRSVIPAGDISSDAHLVYSQLTDRATRIKTVLEAKPEATIKDISEVITDISEKTIQRELNSLIEKGEVIRQGERRWSRYSLAR